MIWRGKRRAKIIKNQVLIHDSKQTYLLELASRNRLSLSTRLNIIITKQIQNKTRKQNKQTSYFGESNHLAMCVLEVGSGPKEGCTPRVHWICRNQKCMSKANTKFTWLSDPEQNIAGWIWLPWMPQRKLHPPADTRKICALWTHTTLVGPFLHGM